MKKIILVAMMSLSLFACHPSEPKTPGICQANWQYCINSYDQETWCRTRFYFGCTRDDWTRLCAQDLQTCKSNW